MMRPIGPNADRPPMALTMLSDLSSIFLLGMAINASRPYVDLVSENIQSLIGSSSTSSTSSSQKTCPVTKLSKLCMIALPVLSPALLMMYGSDKGQTSAKGPSLLSALSYSSMMTTVGLAFLILPQLMMPKGNDEAKDAGHAIEKKKSQTRKVGFVEDEEIPSEALQMLQKLDQQKVPAGEDTAVVVAKKEKNESAQDKKYLEMLVHNVSHTDFILGLLDKSGYKAPETEESSPFLSGDEDKYILCYPRFSAFDLFSRRVLDEIKGVIAKEGNLDSLRESIISYPKYERSKSTPRYTLVSPLPSEDSLLPVGFDLEKLESPESEEGSGGLSVDANDLASLRLRGRDIPKVNPELMEKNYSRKTFIGKNQSDLLSKGTDDGLKISAVFFPLLSTLLPRWLGQIADKFGGESSDDPSVKKVVVLVSGVGTPRNWTHSMDGNSTEVCTELMELFIKVLYPGVTVVRIHSNTNIFRYDENITFATKELMPCIDKYRDASARSEPYPDEKSDASEQTGERNEFNPDWKQFVSLTYSFADGSAARSHAIQSALRPYRPTYFHFWQLKTFWHQSKVTEEDIEVHSFETMETVPALAVDQASDIVGMVVKEMIAFRSDFVETVKEGGRSDVKKFWLRKTKKPVLAVLLVNKPGVGHIMYRGTNMEVSMPTGSLCAERNVIGTALASDPGLKREDLVMVAVLAAQLPEKQSAPPGPALCQPTAEDPAGSSSFASSSEENPDTDADWDMDTFQSVESDDKKGVTDSKTPAAETLGDSSTDEGGPRQRISLYRDRKTLVSNTGKGVKKERQLLLAKSSKDINPLKPCGACNEWLKKIAESNPYFKVLTFTDAQCNGVYVSPCQE